MNFDDSVPLPIGTEMPNSTVLANSMLLVYVENIEVQDETDSGWPTILTLHRAEASIGIAIDYLGLHTEKTGMEEVDLVLIYQDGEWTWRAIVAFSSKSNAIEGGRYETDGYDGYEFVPWKADDRFDRMEALIEEDVTPIAYTKGEPTYAAHAMQEADKIDVLNRMFGIGGLKTLTRRRERLFNRVVPQEVRWKDEGTSLQNLAEQIVGADEDTPDPADER